jgi:hypothetical protein
VLLERRWPQVLAVQLDQVITAVSLQRVGRSLRMDAGLDEGEEP